MSKHIRPSHQYDESYVPSNLVHLLKRYGEIHALDNDYMSQLHFLAVKAAGEIERLQARNEVLERVLEVSHEFINCEWDTERGSDVCGYLEAAIAAAQEVKE